MEQILEEKYINHVTTLLRVETDRIVDEIYMKDGYIFGKYTVTEIPNVHEKTIVEFKACLVNNSVIKIVKPLTNHFFNEITIVIQSIDVIDGYIKNNTTNAEYEASLTLNMKLVDLVDKLNKDVIKFELHGHFQNLHGSTKWIVEHFTERIIYEYGHLLDNVNGENDDKWNSTKDKTREEIDIHNKTMRNYYQAVLEAPIKTNMRLFEIDYECSCGRKFYIRMKDENTISVMISYGDRNSGIFDLTCEYKDGLKSYGGTINIESDMVLTNFMIALKDDCPKDKEYSTEYNLNSFKGRSNIAKWKAINQNVAYGQMGNMSLSVYVNEEKDHIILTECYIESEIKIKKLEDMKYTLVDDISLEVWRWEATDMKTLESAFEKMEDKETDTIMEAYEENNRDIVIIPVKHGKWKFTHYYDSTPNPTDEDELFIYAELELIK